MRGREPPLPPGAIGNEVKDDSQVQRNRKIGKEMIEFRILHENNMKVHANHLHDVFLMVSQLDAVFRKM